MKMQKQLYIINDYGQITIALKALMYEKGKTRLDILSYQYYNDPDYAWLILQANPQYGSMEFNIPDLSELRIPFPLDAAIEGYNNAIVEYNKSH